MSVQTYALVSAGSVVNLVLWDGTTPFNLAPAILVPATSSASIGATYSNGIFTPPAAVISTPTIISTPLQAVAQLGQLLTPEIASLIAVAANISTETAVPAETPGMLGSLLNAITSFFTPS